MASIQANMLKFLLRMRVKRELTSNAKLVHHLRSAMDTKLFPSPLPSGVRVRQASVAGVPGEWLEVADPRMTMLYLHGGAFIGGKLSTYHTFCGELAKRLHARIFLPDYRLAPEHPYPAAQDDCEAAALWWLPQHIAYIYIQYYLSWAPHHPANETTRYRHTRSFRAALGNIGSLGMQYHIVHHLHPRIPFLRTPRAYGEMRDVLDAQGARLEDH